jgi:RNA polymerase sigma-70 factor (ECF subfamily)
LPLPALDDGALARALVTGHPGAGAAAWRRFAPLVRRLLARVLGPGDEIEDHLHETFVRLLRSVSDIREPSQLSSFVVGITMRVAWNELRRRRLRRWLRLTDTGALPELGADVADHAAREALRRLYAVLDRLDDRSRGLFVLRYVEGLGLAEISRALGCSLATTKRRLARALARVLLLARKEPALAQYLESVASGTPGSPDEEVADDER